MFSCKKEKNQNGKKNEVKSYSFAIVADYNVSTHSDTTGNNSGEGSSRLLKNLGEMGKIAILEKKVTSFGFIYLEKNRISMESKRY